MGLKLTPSGAGPAVGTAVDRTEEFRKAEEFHRAVIVDSLPAAEDLRAAGTPGTIVAAPTIQVGVEIHEAWDRLTWG